MIGFLDGEIAEKADGVVVVSVGGTGYEVMVPAQTLARLPSPGRRVRLFTRLQLRDEAMVLYGFSSPDERGLFDHLITVSGVGPKVALAILSVLAPLALRRAVASGDAAALTLVPGVGKKVAGRIILDLKDKIGAGGEAAASGPLAEVREALLALGLSAQEAREALAALAPDGDRPVQELLREALRSVGRGGAA
ncbi:MAG: Holliday junction branch migration protein RuvA [Actinomycetota bacterium]